MGHVDLNPALSAQNKSDLVIDISTKQNNIFQQSRIEIVGYVLKRKRILI